MMPDIPNIKRGAGECFSGVATPTTPPLSGSPVGKAASSAEVMAPCVKPNVTDAHLTWLEVKHARCLWFVPMFQADRRSSERVTSPLFLVIGP